MVFYEFALGRCINLMKNLQVGCLELHFVVEINNAHEPNYLAINLGWSFRGKDGLNMECWQLSTRLGVGRTCFSLTCCVEIVRIVVFHSHSLMGLTVSFVSYFNERGNGVPYITSLGCYL